MRAIAVFLQEVAEYLETNDYCHMHFRDWFPSWDKKSHVDIQITVEKEHA